MTESERKTRRLGYARIVTLDADLSHDPSDIPRLLAMLDSGADVAIGSRFAPGGSLDYRGVRRVISLGANILARRLLRLSLTEHTNSLRAARLDRVPPGLVETVDHEGYAFFVASIRQVVRAGLNVVEIPIHFHDRRHGSSKLPPIEIVYGLLTLMRLTRLGKRAAPFRELTDHICPNCERAYCVRAPTSPTGWRCLACSSANDSESDDRPRISAQTA